MNTTISVSLALASLSLATVPNTFSAGRAVVAREVNENFSYLDSSVAKKADLAATAKAISDTAKAIRQGALSTSGGTVTGPVVINHNLDIGGGGVVQIRNAGGLYSSFVQVRDTLQLSKLAGTGSRIVVANSNGTLTTGIDANTLVTGGPYLPTSGGALSGNLRIPDGDLYLRAPSNDFNHGIGFYGGAKTWGGQAIDGPVVYGCTGGALGTVRTGSTPQKIALRWNESGDVTVAGNLTTYGESNFIYDTTGAVDPAPSVPYDAKFRKYGIATTKLLVTGSATIHGTIVSNGIPASNVADYVFEPDYKLTPLSEVEAFAKEHKHLPEVPSATEIGKSGLDLAQMNLVLLKKVEELTLHAIAQQKEIAELKASVQQLKTR